MSDISVTIGGDFCPEGRPQAALLDGSLSPDAIVGFVRPLFTGSDIGMVNLECPLSGRGSPILKAGRAIRARPETVGILKHLGVTGVTLANNHVGDFGIEGIEDTLALCSAGGICTVGAGLALEAARQPLFVPVRGRVVGFINAAEQEFGIAAPKRAGANPLNLIDLLRDLRQAKAQADCVVLIIHGGLEFTHCPSPESIRLLRFLAEQGVAAIIRHHAHYVQGHEVWKGVPIFYSLGNMLFDHAFDMGAGWHEGLVVKLRISPENNCTAELHPVRQCDGQPTVRVYGDDERKRFARRMADYSALLADESALLRAWETALQPLRETYFGNLLIPTYTLRRILRRLGLMRFVHPGPRAARYWENLLRCDTHREALLDILGTAPCKQDVKKKGQTPH